MYKLIKSIIALILVTHSLCAITSTLNYQNMDGMQIYYIYNDSYYYYATLTDDSSKITINMNLYSADNTTTVDKNNGVWAGIGFGSNGMPNSDIVLFTYSPSTGFDCADYWSPGYSIASDVSLGGNNDVTFIQAASSSTNSTFAPYNSYYTWTCSKNLASLDKYDWKDFQNWQTNNSPTIGAVGSIGSSGQILQHNNYSGILKLVDGENVPTPGAYQTSGAILKFTMLIMIIYVILF